MNAKYAHNALSENFYILNLKLFLRNSQLGYPGRIPIRDWVSNYAVNCTTKSMSEVYACYCSVKRNTQQIIRRYHTACFMSPRRSGWSKRWCVLCLVLEYLCRIRWRNHPQIRFFNWVKLLDSLPLNIFISISHDFITALELISHRKAFIIANGSYGHLLSHPRCCLSWPNYSLQQAQ